MQTDVKYDLPKFKNLTYSCVQIQQRNLEQLISIQANLTEVLPQSVVLLYDVEYSPMHVFSFENIEYIFRLGKLKKYHD